jgi:hypothetical protein
LRLSWQCWIAALLLGLAEIEHGNIRERQC